MSSGSSRANDARVFCRPSLAAPAAASRRCCGGSGRCHHHQGSFHVGSRAGNRPLLEASWLLVFDMNFKALVFFPANVPRTLRIPVATEGVRENKTIHANITIQVKWIAATLKFDTSPLGIECYSTEQHHRNSGAASYAADSSSCTAPIHEDESIYSGSQFNRIDRQCETQR